MFYSERWQDEALQQPAHEQEISSMHLLQYLVKYKLTLIRESRLWGKIYLRLIKSLLTPKIWLLILPSCCCCYTFPSKLVTGILCMTKLISCTWWVRVFVTILWTQKGCLLCELDCRHVCIRCLLSLLNIKMFIGPVAWSCNAISRQYSHCLFTE